MLQTTQDHAISYFDWVCGTIFQVKRPTIFTP
nr:MAG TPA: hypothetical protein [Caudoviricetes sp.]